jgi:hypothetical protein
LSGVNKSLKAFIAASSLPLLQFVVATTEDDEKSASRLKFWGVLIGLVLLGIALDSLPDSAKLLPKWPMLVRLASQPWLMDLLNKLGDAAIIAAILAVAVDGYVKQKLVSEVAREAVDFAVGYALPQQVKQHIQHILRMPFVRQNVAFTYEFAATASGANADEYLEVKCTASYDIVNLTDRDMKFNVRTAVQKAHYPGLGENRLCLLQVAGLRRSETNLKELAKKQEGRTTTDVLYTSVTEEVVIPHGAQKGVPVVTKRVSYHRRDDDIFLDILPPPSLGLTLKVKGLRGYEVGASFGASESSTAKYEPDKDEWTWKVEDVVLPGSHLYLAWHPQQA